MKTATTAWTRMYAHSGYLALLDNARSLQRWSLGGNAANNVTVLAQCAGVQAQLLSALPADGLMAPVLDMLLMRARLDVTRCVRRVGAQLPLSSRLI